MGAKNPQNFRDFLPFNFAPLAVALYQCSASPWAAPNTHPDHNDPAATSATPAVINNPIEHKRQNLGYNKGFIRHTYDNVANNLTSRKVGFIVL